MEKLSFNVRNGAVSLKKLFVRTLQSFQKQNYMSSYSIMLKLHIIMRYEMVHMK